MKRKEMPTRFLASSTITLQCMNEELNPYTSRHIEGANV